MEWTYRFDDPLLFVAALLPGPLQLLQVGGQHERLREETKLLLPVVHLEPRQVPPKPVLATDLEGPWEMVDLKKHNNMNDICENMKWYRQKYTRCLNTSWHKKYLLSKD